MARIDIDAASVESISPGEADELTAIEVDRETESIELSDLGAALTLTWSHLSAGRPPVAVPAEGATVVVPSRRGFEARGASFNLSGPMATACTVTPRK